MLQLRVRTVTQVFLLAVLAACFFSAGLGYVFAQSEAGVSISPALIEETVDPQTTKEYAITIKNLNPTPQKFYLSTKDIIDVSETGAPQFSDRKEVTGMELANWISLAASEVTLEPGVSQEVRFTLAVPADATPGSHFGSIIISVDAPEFDASGATVAYQVANIVSIRVSGDANDSANIRQFSTDSYFHGSKNVDFSVRIENTGNVLVRPAGPLEIYNMLGQQVGSIVFNESQHAVFPGNVREYAFNWTDEGTGFGRYEAVVSPIYGEDGAKKTLSSTVSFWVLPLNIIGPAAAALLLILLITYFLVRLYIKRTLAHLAPSNSRMVRRRRGKGVSSLLLLLVVMLTVTAVFMVILLAVFA